MWAGGGPAGAIWRAGFGGMVRTLLASSRVGLPARVTVVSEKATMTDGAEVGGALQGVGSMQRMRVMVSLGEENSVAVRLWVRSAGAGPRNSRALSPRRPPSSSPRRKSEGRVAGIFDGMAL